MEVEAQPQEVQKQIPCNVCDEVFTNLKDAKEHRQVHFNYKLSCPFHSCNQVFVYETTYKQHYAAAHLPKLQRGHKKKKIPAAKKVMFNGNVEAVEPVFCSMTPKEKERNEVSLARLLDNVESPDFDLFPVEQIKEIKAMMHSLRLGFSNVRDIDEKKDVLINNGVNLNELGNLGEASHVQSMNFLKEFSLEPISVDPGVQSNANMDYESLKPSLFSGPKGSRNFSSLFDLHGDSLPSAKHQTPPPLPVQKSQVVGDTIIKLNLESSNVAEKNENATMHLNETDALEAVSIYEQKLGLTSRLLSNRLPSPISLQECNVCADDSNEEVSSSFTTGSVGIVCPSIAVQSAGPAATLHVGSPSGETPGVSKTTGQLNSCLRPVLRAPTKNGDLRLSFAQPEVDPLDVNQQHSLSTPTNQPIGVKVISRKHNIAPESPFNDRTLKRLRNGFTDIEVSIDAHLVLHGWLEDRCTFDSLTVDRIQQKEHMGTGLGKPKNGETGSANIQYPSTGIFNVITGGNEQVTELNTSTTTNTVSVPSLMKEVVVNTTMLNPNMKQKSLSASLQNSFDPTQIATLPATNSSMMQGTGPLLNVVSSKSLDIEQNPTRRSPVAAQTVSKNLMGELGKIHMKPRVPRRIFLRSTFQQNESLGSEQLKTNGAHALCTLPSKENSPVRFQGDQAQRFFGFFICFFIRYFLAVHQEVEKFLAQFRYCCLSFYLKMSNILL